MPRTGRPVEHTDTTLFARWMTERRLTIAQAAELLGMSVSTIKAYRAGHLGDRVFEPDKRTLLAMAAVSAGLDPYADAA